MTFRFLVLLLASAALGAFAQTPTPTQDTVVNLGAAGPLGSKAAVKISWKKSQVTFAVGSCTIDGSGACALAVSISSRTGYLPAALQFDLTYGSDVSGVTFAVGPAAAAAQKTITCAPVSGGSRCVVVGVNALTMADGVVATATVQTVTSSASPSTVALLGTVSASLKGTEIASIIAPGGGVITMPAIVATVSCAAPDIWTDQVVSCTANLNKPAAADVSIALSSDSSLVMVPATVTIAAGATSATFNATGNL